MKCLLNEFELCLPKNFPEQTHWQFQELLTDRALYEEGLAMVHCAGAYARRCAQGYTALVSLRRNGARCLTLEVALPSLRILQILGMRNRPCTLEERAVVSAGGSPA